MKFVKFLIWLLVCLFQVGNSSGVRLGGIFSEAVIKEPTTNNPEMGIHEENEPTPIQNLIESKGLDQRIRLAFEFSVLMLNKVGDTILRNKTFTQNILSYKEGPLKSFDVMKQTCEQLYIGVAAIVGYQYSSFISSVCNEKDMPYIYIREDPSEISENIRPTEVDTTLQMSHTQYSFQMEPASHTLRKAILDLIVYYRWRKIAVVYCDNSGLGRLSSLIQTLIVNHSADVTVLRAGVNNDQLNSLLKVIMQKKITKILLDCSPHHVLLLVLKKALEMDLLNNRFHYILVELDSCLLLRHNKYVFGHCNITCLGIAQDKPLEDKIYSRWNTFLLSKLDREQLSSYAINGTKIPLTEFSTGAALMYDGLQMYAKALADVYHSNSFKHRSLLCTGDKKWDFGKHLARSMRLTNLVGLTGPLQFDEAGMRVNVQFDVMSITYKGLIKIGKFNDGFNSKQRLSMFTSLLEKKDDNTSSFLNKTFIVTTIVEDPYVFRHKTSFNESIYSGYCIDLLQLLADDVGFTYKIREVADSEYGTMRDDGTWDGMIGELKTAIADIAVAPLTITYDREKDTCFTKPYMSLGVSILYGKPVPGNPSLFGFLKPLSLHIWILVLAAYVAVSFLMYLIARLSPYEGTRQTDNQCDSKTNADNFSIMNSLWYGAGSLMQQGSDFSPRSMSTRLLAAVWWFFSLIFISSYTANLAAFLTVTRMEVDISSADDLAAQTKIKYGTLKDGATSTFFRNSKIKTYSQMWQYLNTTNDVFVQTNRDGVERVMQGGYAYLMESPTLQYIVNRNCNLTQVGGLLDARGYGVATMDPVLRDRLSVAILKLQEKGILDELKHKWWTHNTTDCPQEVSSNTQSLDISNLGGAFVFLLIGALVATLAATIEKFIHCRKRANITQVTQEIKDKMKIGNGSAKCNSHIQHKHAVKPCHNSQQSSPAMFYCCTKMLRESTEFDTTVQQKFEQECQPSNSKFNHEKRKHPSVITETVLSDVNEELVTLKEPTEVNSGTLWRMQWDKSLLKNKSRQEANATYMWNKTPDMSSCCDGELSPLAGQPRCGNPHLLNQRDGENDKYSTSWSTPMAGNHLMSKLSEYKQSSM